MLNNNVEKVGFISLPDLMSLDINHQPTRSRKGTDLIFASRWNDIKTDVGTGLQCELWRRFRQVVEASIREHVL
jgi:hypothetical protein